MRFVRGLLSVLVTTGLVFLELPGHANIAPVREFVRGGSVTPADPHQRVRLESEEVIIRLKRKSYVVDATFKLLNTGETTTERVGFPKWVTSREESYPTFIRFEGSVDGLKVDFHEEWDLSRGQRMQSTSPEARNQLAEGQLRNGRLWLVSQVTFPGHERTMIRIRYEARYHGYGSTASYIYGTGSFWKGNIGRAVFIIDSTEVGGTAKISTDFVDGPKPSRILGNEKSTPRPICDYVVKYEVRDFKPNPEAYLSVNIPDRPHGRAPFVFPPPPPMPVRIKKPFDRQGRSN